MDIDFYRIVDGRGEQFRVGVDAIDYETPIETDIFGNKATYPTGEDTAASGDGGSGSSETEDTSDGSSEATPTDDDGVLGVR